MPTLNRKTNTFIYKQNEQILSNLFNVVGDNSEKVYTLDKNPKEYKAGKKILKITVNLKKTPEEKNTSIAPILKMMGVPEKDIPNRIYAI